MNDTGLQELMKFMRENKGIFFYCEEKDCFALVTKHGLTDHDLVPKGAIHCPFSVLDLGDDIENQYLKPAIAAMERCGGET